MQTKRFFFPFLTMLFLFVCQNSLLALRYSILFSGTGASSKVDSVIVHNLSRGTKVTVPTGYILSLTDGASAVNDKTLANNVTVSPNPFQSLTKVSFDAQATGSVSVCVYALDGRLVACSSQYLLQGNNSLQLTLPQGKYILSIAGEGYSYTTQLISNGNDLCTSSITFLNNEPELQQPITKVSKVLSEILVTNMDYAEGEVLLYKAFSGGYLCSILSDVPTVSKTTNFNFIDCTDIDGNHYPVVTIGTQTWVAENLRVTKYRNGDPITLASDNSVWSTLSAGGMCTFNNSTNTDTISKYGRLYNWYAVNDSRMIAPQGWHVPTETEWDTLVAYVDTHFLNSINGAKSIASQQNWKDSPSSIFTVGNNPSVNNSTGFNAKPAGLRGGQTPMYWSLYDAAVYWSATDLDVNNAWGYSLSSSSSSIVKSGGIFKLGFSVRCIKDK